MPDVPTLQTCPQLTALLGVGAENESTDEGAQAIADHVTACAVCMVAEAQLAALVDRYRLAEDSPLPNSLERRLLDLMLNQTCKPSEG
jgi:hypothetical protein